jgi:hypothetical protein
MSRATSTTQGKRRTLNPGHDLKLPLYFLLNIKLEGIIILMNDKLYESLDSSEPNESKRIKLISYLKECIEELPANDEERRKVAYDIAGLLSTKFAQNLSEDDVFEDILTLSGELEVESREDDEKWSHLINLIERL